MQKKYNVTHARLEKWCSCLYERLYEHTDRQLWGIEDIFDWGSEMITPATNTHNTTCHIQMWRLVNGMLDCQLHSFFSRGSLLNILTGLLGPLGPLFSAQGDCYIIFYKCVCVCVCTCQIATEESVCENEWGRGRECVSGWWLSNEIYVSTTVVLDVKLSLNLGFLQHRSFLCCLVQSWLHRSLTHNAFCELSSPFGSIHEQVAEFTQHMARHLRRFK